MGKWLRIPLTLLGHGEGPAGGEIILLNCCKWFQINSTFFTGRSLWISLEGAVDQPQRTQRELTTDPLRRRDSAASRTDVTDKGNPSNPGNPRLVPPAFGCGSAALRSLWFNSFRFRIYRARNWPLSARNCWPGGRPTRSTATMGCSR